mmetsp:Transcript_28166/g.24946  ORF Transcript_28166/g.24946 Transcript_28166/m.24946 type:complete len:95 (+) Transcript_28166:739-1023(+)
MRTAATNNFRKLWGRIENDLEAGEYTLTIDNTYDTSSFAGEKHFYFSNATRFGGKNTFLSIGYLVIGGLSIAAAIFFLVKEKTTKDKRLLPKFD